jgi:hypothetical protein
MTDVTVLIEEAAVAVTTQLLQSENVTVSLQPLVALVEAVAVDENDVAVNVTTQEAEAQANLTVELEQVAVNVLAQPQQESLVLVGIGSPALGWRDYVTQWDVPPSLDGNLPGGSVYSYQLGGVERFRLVPNPYDAAQDAFYAAFDGGALSGLIAARGVSNGGT